MGTWGHLPFENDAASDWVWELEGAEDLSVLSDPLEVINETDADDYLEGAEEAVAAAEVVAALLGRPLDELPEEVEEFVAQNSKKKPSQALVKQAIKAITRITGAEELKDLWDDEGEYTKWKEAVDDLLGRLKG